MSAYGKDLFSGVKTNKVNRSTDYRQHNQKYHIHERRISNDQNWQQHLPYTSILEKHSHRPSSELQEQPPQPTQDQLHRDFVQSNWNTLSYPRSQTRRTKSPLRNLPQEQLPEKLSQKDHSTGETRARKHQESTGLTNTRKENNTTVDPLYLRMTARLLNTT